MPYLLHFIDIVGLGRYDGGCRLEYRKLNMLAAIIQASRLWERQVHWQLPAKG
jgi:hypothetical protein